MSNTIMSTDRKLTGKVYVSAQIYFASDKRTGGRERIVAAGKLISMAREFLSKELHFKNMPIRLCSIRNRSWLGYFSSSTNTTIIKYRHNIRTMLDTLCHEAVHADQYNTGRLEYKWIKGKCVPFWDGKRGPMGTTFSSYYNQPWEVEAREKQGQLLERVIEHLLASKLTNEERLMLL